MYGDADMMEALALLCSLLAAAAEVSFRSRGCFVAVRRGIIMLNVPISRIKQ